MPFEQMRCRQCGEYSFFEDWEMLEVDPRVFDCQCPKCKGYCIIEPDVEDCDEL